MRLISYLSFFILLSTSVFGQDQCTKSSSWWQEYKRFIPREPRAPITVRINLVIPQKSDGTKNYQEDDADVAETWRLIMDHMNKMYRSLKDPKDAICYTGDDFVPSTYIQFEINEIIYVQNDSMWNTANGSGCPKEKNWYLNKIDKELRADPKYDQAINIYMPNGPADEYGLLEDGTDAGDVNRPPCSEMPSYRDLERSSRINLPGLYNKYRKMRYIIPFSEKQNPEGKTWESDIRGWYWYTVCHTLAHELGHSLGLHHHNEYHGRNKCESALMNQLHNKPHNYVQPSEIGKMHRTLRMSNIMNYVKEDTYSPHPLMIADTAHIDIMHKSYEDIIVKAGGELRISCSLTMPEQAKLIVEPGGTLILDGAQISGRGADGQWGGIILQEKRGCSKKNKPKATLIYTNDAESTVKGAEIKTKKKSKKG